MISYFLNWMGPINTQWIAENGEGWCAGRIDLSADFDEPFGTEVAVPIMAGSSWQAFGDWLSRLRTDERWCLDRLVTAFEAETGKTIEWFRKDA